MKLRRVFAAGAWAAAIIAVLAVWIAGGGSVWLGAGAAIFCLPLISWILQLFMRKKIGVSVTAETMAQKAAAVQISVKVKNLGFLSARAVLRVQMQNTLTVEKNILKVFCNVPPRGETSSRILMQSSHCGRIITSVQSVQLLDLCGFLTVRVKQQSPPVRTTVLPNLFPSEVGLSLSDAVSDESESYAASTPGNDFTELFQLREYVPGDNLRRIHWKLTAKTGQMVVREGSLPLQRSLLVFWDKTAGGVMRPAVADALAEGVAAVCQSLSEAGYTYTLGWSGNDSIVLEEAYDTDSLLSLLPRMISDAGAGKSGTASLTENNRESAYGRILLFAHAVPPSLDALCGRSKVTLFLCGKDDGATSCPVLRFTPENCTQRLQNLELLK